jgi:hypothetical protein
LADFLLEARVHPNSQPHNLKVGLVADAGKPFGFKIEKYMFENI